MLIMWKSKLIVRIVVQINFLEHKNDNIILAFAYETYTLDNECIFLTDDYNLFLKAKGALNLPCSLFENKEINKIIILVGK